MAALFEQTNHVSEPRSLLVAKRRRRWTGLLTTFVPDGQNHVTLTDLGLPFLWCAINDTEVAFPGQQNAPRLMVVSGQDYMTDSGEVQDNGIDWGFGNSRVDTTVRSSRGGFRVGNVGSVDIWCVGAGSAHDTCVALVHTNCLDRI